MGCTTCHKFEAQVRIEQGNVARVARRLAFNPDQPRLVDALRKGQGIVAEHQRWLDDHLKREHQ